MAKPHLKQDAIKDTIYDIVANIKPFDAIEQNHITDTLVWIESGVPIFRIQKPDNPPRHLVSYFVLFDEVASKILLVDQKKAQLWLPPGGHVEIDENPFNTVRRECFEELQRFRQIFSVMSLFLSHQLLQLD